VDISQYNPVLDVSEVRQKYKLDGKINVLFVGRICVEKGVEYLVRAADIVINHFNKDNVQFLIVGPAEQFGNGGNTKSYYVSKIVGLVNSFGLQSKIHLTGAVDIDDKRKLYAACDMVVIPSIVDLDPQVQIEAMASGKPVIGTRIGTMPHRIKDGQSGFIIDPANEKQIAERILYFLNNSIEMIKMGECARKIVSENYSSEIMAARTLEVFQSDY
jgi:glycosyltransferase involved in cell wall biosynthesis